MSKSPEEYAHLEWLGYVQPVGLVVSIPALLQAQCYVNRNIVGDHARFLECLSEEETSGTNGPTIKDLSEFTQRVLGWRDNDLMPIPMSSERNEEQAALEVVLPQYNETLVPTYVVPAFQPAEDTSPWLMLVQELPTGTELDKESETSSSKHWNAPPQAKFERLLREVEVPIGLLFNGIQLRIVYAPRGETSGYLTFNVQEMSQVAGRPIFAALHMLLNEQLLFNAPAGQDLSAILDNSRKYQNSVSTQLAEQVTSALFEFLRGFQAADDAREGELLKQVLENNPQHVYNGILTILMRMVFILYAEDRNLLSEDSVYSNHYSITGLFDRLRSDAGRFPDTMDQRFGAWAQLLTLFRLIFEGGQHSEFKIPPRKGYLFDPNRYPFLEGRYDDGDITIDSAEEQESEIQIPRISDGVIYRVLEDLLILDGERLSYRTLDVEQIGSVYEAVMGFEIQVADGPSIAIKPTKTHGAPATINLETLLAAKSADRPKHLKDWTDQKLGTADNKELKSAQSLDELLSALGKKIAKHVTPGVVPAGSMVLQPSDERRRSGSHYTPRSLTEPIVRTTLEPILNQLCGRRPASQSNGPTHAAQAQQLGIGNAIAAENASTYHTTNSPSRLREGRSPSDGEGSSSPSPIPSPPNSLPPIYEPTRDDKKRYTKGEIEARIRLSQKHRSAAEVAHDIGVPHPWQILNLKICDPAMGSGAFLVEACRQLGDHLIAAWHAHDMVPSDIPADEDEVLYARRLVAQRCLYGVDKNVMAVDLAKLSLWLVTLARDHAFTFLDHSLCHGDSLVGLTREQIIGFHWDRKKFKTLLNEPLQKRLDRATEARAKILNAREDVPYKDQEQRLGVADEALDLIRELGDACVSCFFDPSPLSGGALAAGEKPNPVKATKKSRNEAVDRVYGLASSYLGSLTSTKRERVNPSDAQQTSSGIDFASRTGLKEAAARLTDSSGEHPVPAFHWEIEFPEVFSRENGGFDAFVGNPPFLGGTRISSSYGDGYRDWLLETHIETHGNADLVAHFFRRAFANLRSGGTLGLIATNTIGQGDTRTSGLRWICQNNGKIYWATNRLKWPGLAAVTVSVVHIGKALEVDSCRLNGRPVIQITAYLFHRGSNDDPARLKSNVGLSFLGSKIYGQGFTFDDNDSKGVASPLVEMERLVAKDPKNQDLIFPYIGGEEVNESPTQAHDRYVINFGTRTEEEAREWPDLFEIVEAKVKPARMKQKREIRKKYWWRYGEVAPGLYNAIQNIDRVLVTSQLSHHLSFVFLPNSMVYSQRLYVFPLDGIEAFGLLQSRIHEFFARFYSSTLEDRLSYTASDCFETFPFPNSYSENTEITKASTEYYEHRAAIMVAADEGLTKTYNRFHSREEVDEGILELRRLHGLMDGAVLRAYGWDKLAAQAEAPDFCEFLLDYEEEEDDDPPGTKKKSKKKKPWRYRWPDDFRDEVLARLLELNEQRHKQEQLGSKANDKSSERDNPQASQQDSENEGYESQLF